MSIQPWITLDEIAYPDDPEARATIAAVTFLLYGMSGRKYPGLQTVTDLYEVPIDAPVRYFPIASSVVTAPGRRRLRTQWPELRLRLRPVLSVLEVKVGLDQRLVPSSEYRLYSGGILRPTLGATWTPFGMVEVTYTGGATPPEAAKRAARVLTNELLKARLDQKNCQLPERVTSITRQGTSLTVLDPQDFLEHGRTGIYEVDLFLKTANPAKALARAKVFSPDIPRVRRVPSSTFVTELGRTDLAVVPGVELEQTFTWAVAGKAVSLTGIWAPVCGVYDTEGGSLLTDLTSYVDIEPDSVTGTIKLSIPASVTAGIAAGTYWTLGLSRVASPSVVVRITSGTITIE